jgi:hypothetical protein
VDNADLGTALPQSDPEDGGNHQQVMAVGPSREQLLQLGHQLLSI